jgi:hypothetical protein
MAITVSARNAIIQPARAHPRSKRFATPQART